MDQWSQKRKKWGEGESACFECLSEGSHSLFISHLLALTSLAAQVHGQGEWSLSMGPWPLGILERPWVAGSLNVPCLLTPPLIGSSISLLLDALSSPSLLDSFSHYHDVTSISALQPSSSQLKHAIQGKDRSIGASAASPKLHGPIRSLLTCLPYSGATLDDCSFSKTWLPCHFLWEALPAFPTDPITSSVLSQQQFKTHLQWALPQVNQPNGQDGILFISLPVHLHLPYCACSAHIYKWSKWRMNPITLFATLLATSFSSFNSHISLVGGTIIIFILTEKETEARSG